MRRAPAHKPVYFLVFGTRNSLGIWHFADDTARATEKWWSTFDMQEAARLEEKVGQEPLFPPSLFIRQDLSEVEAEARSVIAENIAALVASRGQCRMRDFPPKSLVTTLDESAKRWYGLLSRTFTSRDGRRAMG